MIGEYPVDVHVRAEPVQRDDNHGPPVDQVAESLRIPTTMDTYKDT